MNNFCCFLLYTTYFGEAAGYGRDIDTFNEIELVAFAAPADDDE